MDIPTERSSEVLGRMRKAALMLMVGRLEEVVEMYLGLKMYGFAGRSVIGVNRWRFLL